MKRYFLLLVWCALNQACLLNAQDLLLNNDAETTDEGHLIRKIKKVSRVDKLFTNYLNVAQNLFVNGNPITGTASLSSYGQLLLSAQGINFTSANTWMPIPFDATGLSSEMGLSIVSPATITVQQAGVYQISFSMYFIADLDDEGIFDSTNYTLGLNINGTTTPVAGVYAASPGSYTLNYSSIVSLAENDYVQFYMEASVGNIPPFSNNVTLERGNAYLMQISN